MKATFSTEGLVIFDMEGVLVDGEFLPELAKLIGKETEVQEITHRGIRGEIVWEEGLKQRIKLLQGVSRAQVEEVARSIPLMKGAKALCQALKAKGFQIISVTGGFGVVAQRVKRELQLDHVYSNELIFRDGRLYGFKLRVTSNKAEALQGLLKHLKAEREKTTAVVDGANDLNLFELAGLKIALNAQEIVKKLADVSVDEKDLTLLLPIIGERF